MATPLRVLILEDQPADAELMLHELRRAGFTPVWERVETEAEYLAHLLSPTAKNGMKLVDQTSPFSFKMDSPNRLQSPYPHQE
jgi:hypothetical protein